MHPHYEPMIGGMRVENSHGIPSGAGALKNKKIRAELLHHADGFEGIGKTRILHLLRLHTFWLDCIDAIAADPSAHLHVVKGHIAPEWEYNSLKRTNKEAYLADSEKGNALAKKLTIELIEYAKSKMPGHVSVSLGEMEPNKIKRELSGQVYNLIRSRGWKDIETTMMIFGQTYCPPSMKTASNEHSCINEADEALKKKKYKTDILAEWSITP